MKALDLETTTRAMLASGEAETDARGRRRRTGTRATTESIRRLPKYRLALVAAEYPEQPGVDYQRPRTRAECQGHDGPCPYVSCQYHLALDVNESNGNIKHNFPGVEVWELAETCALDVADRGGITLEEVGAIMNLTRERCRQIEDLSLARLKALDATVALVDHLDDATPSPTGDLRARVVGIRHTPDATRGGR